MRNLSVVWLLKVVVVVYIIGMAFIITRLLSKTKDDVLNCGANSVWDRVDETKLLMKTFQNASAGEESRLPYANYNIPIPRKHNHLEKRNNIIGPGKDGKFVQIPEGIQTEKLLIHFHKRYGFNTLLSDVIGVHRSFGDCRPQACRYKEYPPDLPPASVVIIFRDEYTSIVLRTAYSVLDTTPPHLLKEIVLVDDGSVDENMTLVVNLHVANVKKFRLLRNEKPQGLMMARQRGIEATTADYFIVMDSHMEVCEGWIEPIINRLVQKPKNLLSPQVGGINPNTFELEISDTFHDGFMFFSQITMGQTWSEYTREFIKARNGSVDPILFPIMQGMVLAMRKDFFLQLRGFDTGMRVWGTEQIELSVKVWLCGGKVELVPCSRVAHMFRSTRWGVTLDNVNHIAYNRYRFATTWLEAEHRDVVLELQLEKGAAPSSVDDRIAIRDANNCKPYQFFIDQVKQFSNIYEVKNTLAYGTVFNTYNGKCWDVVRVNRSEIGTIKMYSCHSFDNQYFILTDKCQIRIEQHVVYVKANSTTLNTQLTVMEWKNTSSVFIYKNNNSIVHEASGLCATAVDTLVELRPCDGSSAQQWIMKRLRRAECKPLDG